MRTRSRPPTVYTEVEVDPDDIESAGYHHEQDCPANEERWTQAAQILHLQAHPDEPLDMARCRREPCRTVHDAAAVEVNLERVRP